MPIRHYNIPIFIPELACPHRCIFCNQSRISGVEKIPQPDEVAKIIEQHLLSIPKINSIIQIAFFGGSFTALPINIQIDYLNSAQPYLEDGISGIRISTRPDYINEEILIMLKEYHVTHIELGAQSMIDEVLKSSARGHNVDDVLKASELILKYGFTLGLQMMIGLPGDSIEFSLQTARAIINAGATETRIYPTLVIKNTPLEKLWKEGEYQVLELHDAVKLTAELYQLFDQNSVKVLRTGLYPSDDLANGEGLLAGPFHPNFKELVMSEIWRKKLMEVKLNKKEINEIFVPQKLFNHAIGFEKSNTIYLNNLGYKVKFKVDSNLQNFDFYVNNRG